MPTLENGASKPISMPAKLEYHPTIHDMPSDERHRERLKNYGSKSLSTSELLAIILRTGTARDNVIELATKLLLKYGGLSGLMRADFGELCAEHGLGEAKASQLKAALEMGRRLGMLSNEEKYQIKSPADAANLVMVKLLNCLPTVRPTRWSCQARSGRTLRPATQGSPGLCARGRYESRNYSRKSD